MIYFINYDLLIDPVSTMLIEGIIGENGNAVYIIGPTKSHNYDNCIISAKSKTIGCERVIFPATNTKIDLMLEIREILDQEESNGATMISEHPIHQAVADMIGIEFVRGFDWIKE